jgi:hypothetical protein
MSQSWSDFSTVDKRPDAATHQLLDENTWNLFVAWTAGPQWVVATPDRVTPEPVIESGEEKRDGTVDYWERPFSSEDQQESDDDVDATLATVGLPPRPRGYDWYLKLTASQERVFSDRYGDRVEHGLPGTMDSKDYLTHIYTVMSDLVPEALRFACHGDSSAS